jgi:hypothetical protein
METVIKANSVPMLTSSASLFNGNAPAKNATNTQVIQELTMGVCFFLSTFEKTVIFYRFFPENFP